jgi:hypothetical protein
MDLNVKIVTFAPGDELAEFSAPFLDGLPFPKERRADFTNDYLTTLLGIEADWLVHVDVDAFVFATERITGLIRHMEAGGYVCCGMPDGGVVSVRGHNPVACNPFFMIVHRRALKDALLGDPGFARTSWDEQYREHTPELVRQRDLPYAYDDYEPYYGFFFWLCKHRFKVLHLDAEPSPHEPEQITTLLKDQESRPFLLHTWYAREYMRTEPRWPALMRIPLLRRWLPRCRRPGPHFDRINRVIARARELRHAAGSA